jgi:hypothetical protein
MPKVAWPLLVAALVATATGCEDIRRFEADWAGTVSADPAHRQGFPDGAPMRVTISTVSRRGLEATIALPPEGPLPFLPIAHARDDILGDLRLEGEPLRTFLGFLRPPAGEPYLTVVSLFSEDRVDVRVIRGPDEAYGVFTLYRTRPVTPR